MTIQGCDYSDSDIPTALLTAHGAWFAARYVSTLGNKKNLTLGEATSHANAGIRNVTIFETTEYRALDGYTAGVSDARLAEIQAQALQQPIGTPIYFAVDFEPNDNQLMTVDDYFAGIVATLTHYKVGVYGGYETVAYLDLHHLVDYIFQTYAWSGGKWFATTHLRQYRNAQSWGPHQVDLCEALAADFGGWFPGGFTPPGAPTPPGGPTPPAATDWMTTIMDRLPQIETGAHDPIAGQYYVRRAQALLKDVAGKPVGNVDGIFGPATEQAVKSFQRDRHLTADGIVGQHTWAYLVTGADV